MTSNALNDIAQRYALAHVEYRQAILAGDKSAENIAYMKLLVTHNEMTDEAERIAERLSRYRDPQ